MKKILNGLDEGTRKLVLTFIRILIILAIIVIIFMIIVSCSNKGNNYTKLENVMENAATNYYNSHKDDLPSSLGESKKITISELVNSGYMKNVTSYVTDASCDGYVIVTKNSTDYLYNPYVSCGEYKTNTISSIIKDAVVASSDGVYAMDGGYYYRGNRVNNYIQIGNLTYMIIGMDSNNNVKVIEAEAEKQSIIWDNRYNVEKGTSGTGMNDFERSVLQEKLQEKYEMMGPEIKKYILYSDWCVGKRSADDAFEEVECDVTSKAYIATINAYEFARISIEEQCTNVLSGACVNYNFISDKFDSAYWTLTPVAGNTYQSYYLYNGSLDTSYVSRYYKVIKSFNISGNNIVTSGDGSLDNPYKIK